VATLDIQNSASLHNYWPIRYPQGEALPSIQIAGAEAPAWWPSVELRLMELMRLPPDWDGRGSRRLNPNDIVAAVHFLAEVMRPDTAAPWIGPLNSGGVQLAWKHGDVEAEAVFDEARGERDLLVAVGDNECEAPIESAASLFATVVDRLCAAEFAA
jgi:hypothetical protein